MGEQNSRSVGFFEKLDVKKATCDESNEQGIHEQKGQPEEVN